MSDYYNSGRMEGLSVKTEAREEKCENCLFRLQWTFTNPEIRKYLEQNVNLF